MAAPVTKKQHEKPIALEIGRLYDVGIEDCCLHVYFTATLIASDNDETMPLLTFDNGVQLQTYPTTQIKRA